MKIFNFGVATEPNNYYNEEEDKIWIKNDKGQLILMEDTQNESNQNEG